MKGKKGKTYGRKGNKMSEETKERISRTAKGRSRKYSLESLRGRGGLDL